MLTPEFRHVPTANCNYAAWEQYITLFVAQPLAGWPYDHKLLSLVKEHAELPWISLIRTTNPKGLVYSNVVTLHKIRICD